jgi:hypothetical protein
VWLSVPSISCHGLETWWHDGALLRGSVEVDETRQVVVVAYADEKEDANTLTNFLPTLHWWLWSPLVVVYLKSEMKTICTKNRSKLKRVCVMHA